MSKRLLWQFGLFDSPKRCRCTPEFRISDDLASKYPLDNSYIGQLLRGLFILYTSLEKPQYLRLPCAWLLAVNIIRQINYAGSLKRSSHKSKSQFCKVGEFTRQSMGQYSGYHGKSCIK